METRQVARGASRRVGRSADGTEISVRVRGSGRRAVALLHGWMASGSLWDGVVERLSPEDRVVVPDLRGAGASAPGRDGYALERYAEDVAAALDAAGVRQAVLVGHSMGGQVALLVASLVPERVSGLVLVCPVPAGGLALPPEARALFAGSGGDSEAQGRILDLASPALEPAARARLLDDAARIPAGAIAASFEAFSAGGFEGRVPGVRARTLVVASDDPFLPPALLREQVVRPLASARLVRIGGAGHYVPVERPEAVAALVEAFVAGLGDG